LKYEITANKRVKKNIMMIECGVGTEKVAKLELEKKNKDQTEMQIFWHFSRPPPQSILVPHTNLIIALIYILFYKKN
jgi:hypothetical protein